MTEPVFGQDVSFYVFELPMIAYARSIAVGIVVISILASGVYYLFQQSSMGQGPQPIPVAGLAPPRARRESCSSWQPSAGGWTATTSSSRRMVRSGVSATRMSMRGSLRSG